ncbi:hypothetical protein TNIN_372581 [Trichonephila inaurata madagascariensis]|uniref:Uncharacterized protein n=1 Tax=Trichonephila inaurata madagascariensis TaxID=2747483 RepID=A0A8X6Y7T8_9ARAC|nr:hypothetical protein TNIN_372581 [Trichonephila inaurata madagascariensis]
MEAHVFLRSQRTTKEQSAKSVLGNFCPFQMVNQREDNPEDRTLLAALEKGKSLTRMLAKDFPNFNPSTVFVAPKKLQKSGKTLDGFPPSTDNNRPIGSNVRGIAANELTPF